MSLREIHIGMDFNAGNCSAVAGIYDVTLPQSERKFSVFQEFVHYYDTPELIDAIKDQFDNFRIYVYPDATGVKRSSINAHTSDISLLKEAKFRIRAKTSNPLVRDRIAAVNRAFEQNKLQIDVNRCPELTECLEQQVFLDNGTPDKKSGYDHLVDALGYPIAYLMPIKKAGIFATASAG